MSSRFVLSAVLSFLAFVVPAGPASALAFGISNAQVMVDTFVQAGTTVDDPAPKTNGSVAVDSRTATFLDPVSFDTALAVATAKNTLIPPVSQFATVKTDLKLTIQAKGRGQLNAATSALGTGSVLLQVAGDEVFGAGAAASVLFDLSLTRLNDLANPFELSFRVEDAATGQVLLNLMGAGGFPDVIAVPARVGDSLQVSYRARLSATATQGSATSSSLILSSRISVVPEPSTIMLLGSGLAFGLLGLRRRRSVA